MTSINAFNHGLLNEISFLLKLQSSLSSHGFSVEKTRDRFAPVDYIVKSDSKVVMYLELKTRTDISNHNSFIVGRVKLERINHYDKPTIIIWVCETTGDLYYIFYSKGLLELNQRVMKNKRITFIPKALCGSSYDDLIDAVK